MLRALSAAGTPINWRTLVRHLSRTAPVQAASTPAALEREAGAALEGDDLARLTRVRDELDVAMASWRSTLACDGSSVRAYAALARIHADVTARLVELRPRPEAEAERLVALGEEARAELLSRASAAATPEELHTQLGRLRAALLADEAAE